jgi:PAS domain S-box-containing protein
MMHLTTPAEHERAAAVPASRHATIDMTPAGMVTSWNPAAVLLYGYLEEEIVGRGASLLVPADGQAVEAEILRRVAGGGQAEGYEAHRVCKDGTLITVSLTAAPILDASGAVVGVSVASWKAGGPEAAADQSGGTIASERRDARDVQDRTDAQRREAREAQERTEVRAAIQRRDARHAQDRIDVQVSVERRDARVAQDQAEAAQDSERRAAQDRFDARRDGERRETLERNQDLQAQVRQIQRMESLGQLAGGVAHDFNNLLAVILSYATFVSRSLDAASASGAGMNWDEARADMEHIEQAVDRAAALTRQLLAFASREAIRPLALDLNEVIGGVQDLLRRAMGEHIQLATSLGSGLGPVLADAGRIEQVLVNLAVNARDAMPGGGTLTIATDDITTAGGDSGAQQEHRVRLQVADTGTGMTPDVIERAFEPFFTTKSASRGTGLGLATVYGILTQAGADVQISSRPGTGTTFTIVLPVTGETAGPAAESVPSDWEPHGETLLVIEDEAELREITRRIFADAGYRVTAAASGPEALEIARCHDGPIHLLITDIVMPHMLGTEVAERMRELRPGAGVLYMSGYASPVFAAQGRLDPDAVLVQKPFSDAELLAKAGQALRSRS